ncbi:MAG TPA: hypothetical protein VGV63_04695 [Acidimicrobiales bacterium]|nr:hypothetical protein [Acidimicrobiales bacterium]
MTVGSRRRSRDGEPGGEDGEQATPDLQASLARYQSGAASDAETAALMRQLISTGSIRALRGSSTADQGPPRVWASIIPVAGRLDIWVDGRRSGSASNVALARYRIVTAARPAKVTWTDDYTAHWERAAT